MPPRCPALLSLASPHNAAAKPTLTGHFIAFANLYVTRPLFADTVHPNTCLCRYPSTPDYAYLVRSRTTHNVTYLCQRWAWQTSAPLPVFTKHCISYPSQYTPFCAAAPLHTVLPFIATAGLYPALLCPRRAIHSFAAALLITTVLCRCSS